jgi:hypothetical protein
MYVGEESWERYQMGQLLLPPNELGRWMEDSDAIFGLGLRQDLRL